MPAVFQASSRLSSLRTLRFPGSTAGVRASPSGDPSIMHVDENATPTSNTSFIVPLSVWQPAISSSSHDRRPTVIMSVPRSGSLAASASMSSTSALSYASSVSCLFTDRERTSTLMSVPFESTHIGRCASRIQLTASQVRPCRTNDAFPNGASAVKLSTSSTSAKDISLVHSP